MSAVIKELYEIIINKKEKYVLNFSQFKLLKILFQKYSFLDGYSRISEIQTK